MQTRRTGAWLIGSRGSVATTTITGAAAIAAGLAPATGVVTATAPFADAGLPGARRPRLRRPRPRRDAARRARGAARRRRRDPARAARGRRRSSSPRPRPRCAPASPTARRAASRAPRSPASPPTCARSASATRSTTSSCSTSAHRAAGRAAPVPRRPRRARRARCDRGLGVLPPSSPLRARGDRGGLRVHRLHAVDRRAAARARGARRGARRPARRQRRQDGRDADEVGRRADVLRPRAARALVGRLQPARRRRRRDARRSRRAPSRRSTPRGGSSTRSSATRSRRRCGSTASATWASGRPPGTTSGSRASSASRMKLQFTWEGCDSALAAPLLLDLARLGALALERGEARLRRGARVLLQGPGRDGRARARPPVRDARALGAPGDRGVRAPAPRAVAELVRLPAVLSVPGDVLVGAAASGQVRDVPRAAGLAAASSCLYLAGMALNDYADREVDAVERPGRPIPSGRVTPGFALGLAGGLTAAVRRPRGRRRRRRGRSRCSRRWRRPCGRTTSR